MGGDELVAPGDLRAAAGEETIPWESFVYAGTDNPTTPVFESDNLSRADLAAWTRRAYRRFYLRPGYVLRRLRRSVSPNEARMNVKGFRMLLQSIKK